jgi:hypothetical protein
MKSNRSGAGGGPSSKQVVNKPVRYGQPSRGVSPAGVNQIGTSRANHAMDAPGRVLRKDVTPIYGGPAPTAAGVKLGNETALTAGQGPGAGRTVRACGSQGQQGPVAGSPKPQGRDILGGFGNDSPNVADRKR